MKTEEEGVTSELRLRSPEKKKVMTKFCQQCRLLTSAQTTCATSPRPSTGRVRGPATRRGRYGFIRGLKGTF